MEEQSYKKHAKVVPVYHWVLSLLLLIALVGGILNLIYAHGDHVQFHTAALVVLLTVVMMILYVFVRTFPLKAQDRAIRAEEKLRYFILTGKPMDSRLTMRQIIALRFAPDDEFVALAQKAANENLSTIAIKQSVKRWKPDHDRL